MVFPQIVWSPHTNTMKGVSRLSAKLKEDPIVRPTRYRAHNSGIVYVRDERIRHHEEVNNTAMTLMTRDVVGRVPSKACRIDLGLQSVRPSISLHVLRRHVEVSGHDKWEPASQRPVCGLLKLGGTIRIATIGTNEDDVALRACDGAGSSVLDRLTAMVARGIPSILAHGCTCQMLPSGKHDTAMIAVC